MPGSQMFIFRYLPNMALLKGQIESRGEELVILQAYNLTVFLSSKGVTDFVHSISLSKRKHRVYGCGLWHSFFTVICSSLFGWTSKDIAECCTVVLTLCLGVRMYVSHDHDSGCLRGSSWLLVAYSLCEYCKERDMIGALFPMALHQQQHLRQSPRIQ